MRRPFEVLLRTGQRVAAVMTRIQSVNPNRHDPYAYLKDVLYRLPSHRRLVHRRSALPSVCV